jgi:hypothetical protein
MYMQTRFLAPIDCLKIPAQYVETSVPDPDPDPLVRGMDPDMYPSIIMQK